MRPTHVYHCDWGTHANKRWQAVATLQADDNFTAEGLAPVCGLAQLIPSIRREVGRRGCALVGFDFPIGIPRSYASLAEIEWFKSFLLLLGSARWSDFFICATRRCEISVHRPFYPFRPGRAKQSHLLEAFGLQHMNDLRRDCEKKHSGRRAACPLFWTLGANQVGKGAIVGWRDVLVPALASGTDVLLWPFDGHLGDLLQSGNIVIAETYPAEYYRRFFPEPLKSKGKQESRRGVSGALLNWASRTQVTVETALRREIENGFASGDDAFDAVVGLFGMLEVVIGRQPPGEPTNHITRNLEGWILGQPTT